MSLAVAPQPLQAVAWKGAENAKIIRRIEHVKLAKRRTFDGAKLAAGLAMKEPLRFIAPEGFDYALQFVTPYVECQTVQRRRE